MEIYEGDVLRRFHSYSKKEYRENNFDHFTEEERIGFLARSLASSFKKKARVLNLSIHIFVTEGIYESLDNCEKICQVLPKSLEGGYTLRLYIYKK